MGIIADVSSESPSSEAERTDEELSLETLAVYHHFAFGIYFNYGPIVTRRTAEKEDKTSRLELN